MAPAAWAAGASGQTPEFFIAKHLAGDWGKVGAEDRGGKPCTTACLAWCETWFRP